MILSINKSAGAIPSRTALLGLLGVCLLVASCATEGTNSESRSSKDGGLSPAAKAAASEPSTVRVVTTLYPLEYFTQRIAGDAAEVVNLISPGVGSHDFEPTPADIRLLESAGLIIYNGSGLEPWLDRALRAIGDDQSIVLEASLGLANASLDGPKDADENGVFDPHVWLDPLIAVEQVDLILEGLSQARPDISGVLAENADALTRNIRRLHLRFEAGLANCRLRHFVTAHAAFGYLALRYGLTQVPISGISPGAEPSPRDLARLTDIVRGLGVMYVMVEPNISPRLAETLAGEADAAVLTLHPLASLTLDESQRGETYLSVMEANLANLRTALECE